MNVDANHQLSIDLPADFPSNPAEVIVLAQPFAARELVVEPASGNDLEATFARMFPRDPALVGVVFHEDPTAPLSADDWPEAIDDEAAP